MPLIAISPILPPFSFSEWQQEDLTPLVQFVKEMALRYQADPTRIYLAGSGDGARLAMLVARQPGVSPTAMVLELRNGSPAVEHIPTDQGAPSILLAATAVGAFLAGLFSGPLGTVCRQGAAVVWSVMGWGASIGAGCRA